MKLSYFDSAHAKGLCCHAMDGPSSRIVPLDCQQKNNWFPRPNIAAIPGPPCHKWSHPWHGVQQVLRLIIESGMRCLVCLQLGFQVKTVYPCTFKAMNSSAFQLLLQYPLAGCRVQSRVCAISLNYQRQIAEWHIFILLKRAGQLVYIKCNIQSRNCATSINFHCRHQLYMCVSQAHCNGL